MVYRIASQRKRTTPAGQELSIFLHCEASLACPDNLLTVAKAAIRTLPLVSTSLSLSQDLAIPSATQHTRKHPFREKLTSKY